ncbi:MAG TPA: ester cyclase [Acidimicrobiales bacterium]|nr:ester cyclase [Acidimicrobiales bacterium]
MPSDARRSFDKAIACWNADDLDGYLELYDERIELHGYSDKPMGKAEVRSFYQGLFASLADIVLEIHEVVEDGAQLACRFTMHGTHTGELAGIAPTGRRVAQPGITILRFDGGHVVERHSVADFASVVAQLSAPRAP